MVEEGRGGNHGCVLGPQDAGAERDERGTGIGEARGLVLREPTLGTDHDRHTVGLPERGPYEAEARLPPTG